MARALPCSGIVCRPADIKCGSRPESGDSAPCSKMGCAQVSEVTMAMTRPLGASAGSGKAILIAHFPKNLHA